MDNLILLDRALEGEYNDGLGVFRGMVSAFIIMAGVGAVIYAISCF